MAKKVVPLRKAQTSNRAFARLQEAILTGELPPGAVLRETKLAREWKISRTPMREAMKSAAAYGLVILKPNHAPTVRVLNKEDIRQIYELRSELEAYALQACWNQITQQDIRYLEALHQKAWKAKTSQVEVYLKFDDELHALWVMKRGNPWLERAIRQLMIFRPNIVPLLRERQNFIESAFVEHTEILHHLKNRDLKKSVSALRRHIRNSSKTLLHVLHKRR